MEDELFLAGKKYVSSKRAAEITGYAKDYVGQLCRGGKLEAKLIGRNWYINLESLMKNRKRSLMLNQTIAEAERTSTPHPSIQKAHPKTTLVDDLNVSFFSDDTPLMPAVAIEKEAPAVVEKQKVVMSAPGAPISTNTDVAPPVPAKIAPKSNADSPTPPPPLPKKRAVVHPGIAAAYQDTDILKEPVRQRRRNSRPAPFGITLALGSVFLVAFAFFYASMLVTVDYSFAEGANQRIVFDGALAAIFSVF